MMYDEELVNGEVEYGAVIPTDTDIDIARAEADAEGINFFEEENAEEEVKRNKAEELHKDLLIMHYILDNSSEAYYEHEGTLRKVFDILGSVIKDIETTYDIEHGTVWVSMDKTYHTYRNGVKVI